MASSKAKCFDLLNNLDSSDRTAFKEALSEAKDFAEGISSAEMYIHATNAAFEVALSERNDLASFVKSQGGYLNKLTVKGLLKPKSATKAKPAAKKEPEDTKVVYKRAKANGSSIVEISQWTKKARSKLAKWIDIRIVQTVADLDELTGVKNPDDVGGGYAIIKDKDGKNVPVIILVAGSIQGRKEAIEILGHEVVGHLGLETMLGKRAFAQLVNQISYLKRTNHKPTMDVIAFLKKAYTNEDGSYALENDPVTEAREVLAHMSEITAKYGPLKKAIQALRLWLSRHGLGGDLDQNEINSLLISAARFTQDTYTGTVVNSDGSVTLALRTTRDFDSKGKPMVVNSRRIPDAKPVASDLSLTSLEKSFELAGKTQLKNIRQLKEILQQRVEGQGINLSETTPEVKEFLIQLGVKDAKQALKSNANAIGWYDNTVSKALAVLSTIHPEIATDENAKFAFTFALAVTSNGLKVKKNFELAERVYSHYKKTGQMPTNLEAGKAQSAINDSLAQFNEKSAEYGIDAYREFMISKFSVSQITKLGFKVTGELQSTEVFGAMTLGPKIGNGFFANLNGHFDQLTIDRWLMRTWGRWTGSLIERRPDMVASKGKELEKHILKLAKTPTKLASFQKALRMDFKIEPSVNAKGKEVFKVTNIEEVAVQIQKMSTSKALRTIFNQSKSGVSIRTSGNSLAGYLDGQKEAPQNGSERSWMRGVFDGVLADMQSDGNAEMTMADLQALLWYPEKRLYDAAKSAEDSEEGYTDDEAPDYANAAIGLAKDQGIDTKTINKAVDTNDSRRRTTAARPDATTSGQDSVQAGASGLDGKQREKFLQQNILWEHRSDRGGVNKTRTYKAANAGTLGGIRGLIHQPTTNYKGVLGSAEAVAVELVEIEQTPENSQVFIDKIENAKSNLEFGASIPVYSVEEYSDMKVFLTKDQSSGFAIKEDGTIVSVFTNGGGNLYSMMSLAVEQGGTKLDTFDTVLPDIYKTAGFVESSRDSWDQSDAPIGWDKSVFSEFNKGKPDTVHMEYAPDKMRKPEKAAPVYSRKSSSYMSKTSRMARAAEMGYVAKAFIGLREGIDIKEFDPNRGEMHRAGTGQWAAGETLQANTYAYKAVVPVVLKTDGFAVVDFGSTNWNDKEDFLILEMPDGSEISAAGMDTNQIARLARSHGVDGVQFNNITDLGPIGRWSSSGALNEYMAEGSHQYAIFDTSTIRSIFAEFNTDNAGSRKVSHSRRGRLGMSKKGRMARAVSMGFDVSQTWYHGTKTNFKGFRGLTFLTSSPDEASSYGGMYELKMNRRLEKELGKVGKTTLPESKTSSEVSYSGVLDDISMGDERAVGRIWATDEGVFKFTKQGFDFVTNAETDYSQDYDYKFDKIHLKPSDSDASFNNYVESVNSAYAGQTDYGDGQVIPVYIKEGKFKKLSWNEANKFGKRLQDETTDLEALQAEIEGYIAEGYIGVDTLSDEGVALAGEEVPQRIMFNPSDIRSINAEFNSDSADNFDLMRSSSPKSDTEGSKDTQADNAEGPDILFSRKPPKDRVLDTDNRKLIDKLGMGKRRSSGLVKAIADIIDAGVINVIDDVGDSMYEGIFDGLIGLKKAEDFLRKGIAANDFAGSAYVAARLATGIADMMTHVMHHGALKWEDGVPVGDYKTKGMLDVLTSLGADADSWFMWMAGNRAEELMREGKEHNLTREDIDVLKSKKTSDNSAKFETAKEEYMAINVAMLDFAQEAGLINPDSRAEWESEWYVPFFRQTEDGAGIVSPNAARGLANQTSGIKMLTGSEASTGNLLENVLANWMRLTDASVKNSATLKMVENLNGTEFMSEVGIEYEKVNISKASINAYINKDRKNAVKVAEWLGMDKTSKEIKIVNAVNKLSTEGYEQLWAATTPTDANVFSVKRNGKTEYYRVSEDHPAVISAINHLGYKGSQNVAMRAGRYFKGLLTVGVTASPDFMLRNFIRDAAHAWAINPDGMTFGLSAIKGAKSAFKEDGIHRMLMAGGASFQGGYVHGTDPEASAEIMRRELVKHGLSRQQAGDHMDARVDTPAKMASMLLDGKDAVSRGWQHYRSAGDKVENSSRIATAASAIEEGKPLAQVLFESKDLMDYSLRGNYALMIFLTDMIPFLNARLQGLSKLGRAGTNRPALVALQMAKIAAFSVALAALNDDDERYKNLQDWEKDAYWHIFMGEQHWAIPKPFEIGIIAGTIPERMYRAWISESQPSEKVTWSIVHGLITTLGLNPIPQFALPIAEVFANRSVFFDTPIESRSDQGKISSQRFNSYTSDLAMAAGDTDLAEWLGLSPKRLQHLWKGYTGTLGAYVLKAADMAVRAASDNPTKTPIGLPDMPLIGAIFKGDRVKSSQFVTDFYDTLGDLEEISTTIKALAKTDRQGLDAARELHGDNKKRLRALPALLKTQKTLRNLRKEREAVLRSDYSPEIKQQRSQLIQRRMNRVAQRVMEGSERFLED